jgi:DNA-binding FrmR family transcriptional regulator
MDTANLHQRISKILGQIRAIDKMVDQYVPCEDLLIQINAAKKALHKVGQGLFVGHIKQWIKEGIEHGNEEQTLSEFAEVGDHFARMG